MSGLTNNRVLWTDAPWSDTDVEQAIFHHAGLEFIRAPSDADLDQIVAKVDPAAIMTCWAAISGETIRQAHDLKIIARLGAGVDNVAVDAATGRGAWVTNVPDYCVGEVSDHAIALMLAHYRGILRLDAQVKSYGWQPDGAGLDRISDLTVGIIGLGRIGSETAGKLKAFGCRVLALTRSRTDCCDLAEPVDLDAIAARSDIIILHLPMNAQTAGMIGTGFLSKCEKKPLILNVSRGAWSITALWSRRWIPERSGAPLLTSLTESRLRPLLSPAARM